MSVELSRQEQLQLQEALLSAFPSQGALEQVVYFELGENLDTIREGDNYKEVVFNLIVWAIANDRIEALITGARRANSGNPKLRAFAETFNAEHRTPEATAALPSPVITAQTRNALIETLLRVPPMFSFEGRSSLLIGLPWAQSLNRSPTNARLDLDLIIEQLDSLGQLDSGSWPVLLLLDNALPYVTGTTIGRQLLRIRGEFEQKYKEAK